MYWVNNYSITLVEGRGIMHDFGDWDVKWDNGYNTNCV